MHPAFSVIFFTVSSGAGYGLFILLSIFHIFGINTMSKEGLLTGGILAFVLIAAGLMSSTFHLANPKNAWRAFSRFKTSWLAREGVFAVMFFPFVMVYLFGIWWQGVQISGFFQAMGLIGAFIALVTVFSTGMIYACLKTIRQWNTALTPANYILLGLALGGLLFTVNAAYDGGVSSAVSGLALALLLVAGVLKAIYYFWIAQVAGPTINTATGFTRASVRLLDTGHTAGTFLTDEFGYQVSAGTTKTLKLLVFVLGFILPGIALALILNDASQAGLARWALLSAVIGVGMERWLFFAEARHVVNTYHGAQHT